MTSLVLCEGKTDAILLSYYLECTCGWMHDKAPQALAIRADEAKGESAYWYTKDGDSLLICGVGGKDKFSIFFKDKILPVMTDSSNCFSKIAVVTDRDDRQETSIAASCVSSFSPIATDIQNNNWVTNSYLNSFGEMVSVDILLLIIPEEKEGALETLLLDAISENKDDKVIVDSSRTYVETIAPKATKYIDKNRLKLKACLGVTWAIQYPEKIFSFIDAQIRSVKWEESDILAQCFRELKKI